MKIFLLDDVEIKIYKSHLAKKITISIRPTGTIRVTIPRYVSYLEAERFAQQKRDWIFTNLTKIEERESKLLQVNFTKRHQLIFESKPIFGIKVQVRNGIIKVSHNSELDQNSLEVREAVKKGILNALRKEAKEYLPPRLYELAVEHNLSYKRVSLKVMKTRWGSCSPSNNINLNIHLMQLPDHLIDYVLKHELIHTLKKNHSHAYWEELEKICPNSKALDRELKSYRI